MAVLRGLAGPIRLDRLQQAETRACRLFTRLSAVQSSTRAARADADGATGACDVRAAGCGGLPPSSVSRWAC